MCLRYLCTRKIQVWLLKPYSRAPVGYGRRSVKLLNCSFLVSTIPLRTFLRQVLRWQDLCLDLTSYFSRSPSFSGILTRIRTFRYVPFFLFNSNIIDKNITNITMYNKYSPHGEKDLVVSTRSLILMNELSCFS